MRISDWSSDVCSSDLNGSGGSMTAQSAAERGAHADTPASLTIAAWREIAGRIWVNSGRHNIKLMAAGVAFYAFLSFVPLLGALIMTYRSEEHTSELESLMRSSYAVFCLNEKILN